MCGSSSRVLYIFKLKDRYSSVKFVKTNVTVWADQLAAFKTALSLSSSGRVDIVVANAGISGADSVFLTDGRSMRTFSDRKLCLADDTHV